MSSMVSSTRKFLVLATVCFYDIEPKQGCYPIYHFSIQLNIQIPVQRTGAINIWSYVYIIKYNSFKCVC